MLYLIKLYGKEKEYLKIGYSKNIKDRTKQYDIHSAETELLDIFEGTLKEENLLLDILKDYIIHNEWMEYNDEIVYLWKLYKILYPELIKLYENQIKNLKEENNKLYKEILEYKNIANKLVELNSKIIESSKLIKNDV